MLVSRLGGPQWYLSASDGGRLHPDCYRGSLYGYACYGQPDFNGFLARQPSQHPSPTPCQPDRDGKDVGLAGRYRQFPVEPLLRIPFGPQPHAPFRVIPHHKSLYTQDTVVPNSSHP